MLTLTHSLRPTGSGLYEVIDADREPFCHPLPLHRAADTVRRLENGAHYGHPSWQVLTADRLPEVLTALGYAPTV